MSCLLSILPSHASSTVDRNALSRLYHTLNTTPNLDINRRILWISKQLLDKPYLLGALGEGDEGQYDQFPLFRLDAFDCETYVDTVLALALAQDEGDIYTCLRNIRYHRGEISFINRNHFTCLDWNKNNQNQGFTEDITHTLHDKQHHPITKTASALIDKPNWYKHLTLRAIRLKATPAQREKQLQKLQQKGQELPSTICSMPYIPLSKLFDAAGNPNYYVFKQIPNAAIIEIVRPNWDLRRQIGTCLNVSHLGWAIWQHGQLFFRQASSIHHRTVDVPLIDYLHEKLTSPTIKGINIQIVKPKKPIHCQ